LWTDLCDLCRLINQGSESLGIYAYNGGLFDPQLHPLLERWQIGDRYLAEALKLLACTEVEGRRGFLDYSALDVRELGSIYEGLLEHKLIRKDGELKWEKDRSERKKTGSYYTPEYIVQYIVEQTIGPLIDEIQNGLKADLDDLSGKIRRARGENRKLLAKKKEKLLRDARERVLDLKILDPAMGSGHFLVSACDYVARRIAELEAELTGEETEEAVQALKRTVAERCLYGVDLNPLATELAKLSLWLHTVAKGKPLSFLDHHLRTGNSLIGARVKDLERPPSGKAHEIGLWESKLVQDLAKAIGYLNFIKASASASRSDIEEKKQRWELVNTWIGKYKQAADVWLSSHFGNTVSDKEFQKVLQAAASNHMDNVVDNPALCQAREIASEKRFFHWEFEFPDVFF
ncbi:N-6 DNA methylase, partial [Candidatus Bipolaricaulota bacterium]|nr:N-6 DNA methylase [Candidatus Bipolaricaulota bacterium]